MIKLQKGPTPAILERKGQLWKEEYLDGVGEGKKRSDLPARYRHPEIKEAVKSESHDKCLYCETKLSHAQYGDVEHIAPASAKPELVVEWKNLGYVCQVCNNNKRDYWDDALPLINPYDDDPQNHFAFFGTFILHKPRGDRGKMTITKLKLNRTALMERRKDRIDRITSLVDEINLMPEGSAKAAMLEFLAEELGSSTEYSAFSGAVAEQHLELSLGEQLRKQVSTANDMDGSCPVVSSAP
ncbi:HNH endonuclease [Micromonospora taraxaci]|uniref:HNH endonuclease n=1 Tax=Micromonospora taraxaci TaxID=1316803 RepID=UPI003403C92D